jgi:predicted ATPase/class 3 adenylate cyclase
VNELPTGTVTFLFTDLESSTRLWDTQPAAMRAALARHDELLATAVAEHRGQIVKTTGDGVHAVFQTADDAVAAAVAAQRAMCSEPWSSIPALRVRMGLHTGVAEQRGHDYFGSVLNRAARLMAAAHPEQILCSRATADLLSDSPHSDVALLELGSHRLRDLERPEVVFQVTHPELPVDFPPLPTPSAGTGNLPAQITSFIGREAELARVAEALGRTPIVTITGVGGVGKTRLAYRAASDARANFADGVWVCELAGVRTGDAVPEALTATLGARPPTGVSVRDALVAYLRNKDLLLVLDNCEHLLSAVTSVVAELVRMCPGVCFLATSRESLNLAGEQILGVPSMSTPDEAAALEAVGASDAVQLFVERARAVEQDFALTAHNASAIAELCRRLDGIPLAIELAAARVGMLTPAELARRLDQRFRLLTGRDRGAVERHQTLRAAVDWSYDLLTPSERRLLDRLSVFAGAFTLDAAEFVTAGDGITAADVFDLLASLVARYLVVAAAEDGETRYRLLETIRQYAQEHLDQNEDAEAVRASHAAFYARFLADGSSHLDDVDALACEARLERELDNLRAGFAWAVDRRRADLTVAFLSAVDTSFAAPDVAKAFQGLTEVALAIPDIEAEPRYARALAVGAYLASNRGDLARAMTLGEQAIAADASAGEPTILAILVLSLVASFTADTERALTLAHDAVARSRTLGDPASLAQALSAAAVANVTLGHMTDGVREAEEIVVLVRRHTMHPRRRSMLLAVAGCALAEAGVSSGIDIVREAQLMASPLEDRSPVWSIVAYVAVLQNDRDAALTSAAKSIGEFYEWGAPVFIGVGLRSLALVLGADAPEAVTVLHGWTIEHSPAYPMFPRFESTYGELVAACADAVGHERVDQLRAEGAAMDIDDVVAYAHAVVERLLEESQPTRGPT